MNIYFVKFDKEERNQRKGNLGETKIELKLDAWPVKHRPYRFNPRFKEKAKK